MHYARAQWRTLLQRSHYKGEQRLVETSQQRRTTTATATATARHDLTCLSSGMSYLAGDLTITSSALSGVVPNPAADWAKQQGKGTEDLRQMGAVNRCQELEVHTLRNSIFLRYVSRQQHGKKRKGEPLLLLLDAHVFQKAFLYLANENRNWKSSDL